MQNERSDTQTILELTREIEAARTAVRDQDSPAARDLLKQAEDVYRAYLMGLNGLDGGRPWPISPL